MLATSENLGAWYSPIAKVASAVAPAAAGFVPGGPQALAAAKALAAARAKGGKEPPAAAAVPFYKRPLVLGLGAAALVGFFLLRKRK